MPVNLIAKAVVTAVLVATQYAITASQKIEGPRLDDTKVSLGDYGVPLPMLWGTRRIEGPPIFFAEDLREVKRRRKTKGGKYNEYTYFGTWAIAVAGHEIDSVTRIWLDKKLVYDVTGAGPTTPFESEEGVNLQDFIRIYNGAETQEADPRMLATVEAANGAGSCPAYRGTAYVMFIDVPLEKFGNRIPQAAVEVVSATTDIYPIETFPRLINGLNFVQAGFSPSGDRFTWNDSINFETWDVASRTRIATGAYPAPIGSNIVTAIDSNGKHYLTDGGSGLPPQYVRVFSNDGFVLAQSVEFPERLGHCIVLAAGEQEYCLVTTRLGLVNGIYYFNVSGSAVIEDPVAWVVQHYCSDGANIWALGSTGGSNITIKCVVGDRAGEVGSLTSPTGSGASEFLHNGAGSFVLRSGNELLLVEDVTFTVTSQATRGPFDANNTKPQFYNYRTGAESIWLNEREVSTLNLSLLRTVNLLNWYSNDTDGLIYDYINDALIASPAIDMEISWYYLDRISGAAVTLQTIANDVAERCGIIEYDFSAFTQLVNGWSATIGTGQDILEPLLDAYDVDIRPHDFTIQGVVRGGASGGTIDVERFVRNGNEPRYTVKIAQAAQIPRAMVLNFADKDKDQQVNSVRVSRPPEATEAAGEATLDMTTWATDTDTARQYLGRYFRRVWNGREMINNALTPQNLALEPADLRTLGLDGENVLARLVKTSLAKDGKMASEWVTDDPDLALLDGGDGPTFDGYVPSVMPIPLLTKGFVIDANLAIDGHDQANPFLYYAAAPYSSGGFWPGADIAISDSGLVLDYVPGWAAVPSSDAMDWGYCTNELGDTLPWIFDYGSTLNIKMQIGSLTGVTEDEILEDAALNLLLIEATGGWEYVQFVDADLQGDGSYNITGLLRGCRGTEHLIASHSAGNVAIVVDNDVFRRTVGASEIGDTDYYRAVSQGRGIETAGEQIVAFGAAANRPYAPVHGVLTRNTGTNDWAISATRRTRIGAANLDGSDVPLGETSQSWEADIMDGVDVVRTIAGTSLPLTYTSAQQVTDWGSNQTSLEVNLYQISPALSLRGYELNIAA